MAEITVQDAVDDLYRIAVTDKKSQSPKRLDVLADFCVQELEKRGLANARKEIEIPGMGRKKKWDVGWEYDGKVRLGITLKSLLKNLPGTVPNRIDDLMGEVSNVQLRSPEIVVGYVMVFDISKDGVSKKHGGKTWYEVFRSFVEGLSGRNPPSWAPGTIEAHVVAKVDFSNRASLRSSQSDFKKFFDLLADRTRDRNPGAFS